MNKLKTTNEATENLQMKTIENPQMKNLKIHKWSNWKSTNEDIENVNETTGNA